MLWSPMKVSVVTAVSPSMGVVQPCLAHGQLALMCCGLPVLRRGVSSPKWAISLRLGDRSGASSPSATRPSLRTAACLEDELGRGMRNELTGVFEGHTGLRPLGTCRSRALAASSDTAQIGWSALASCRDLSFGNGRGTRLPEARSTLLSTNQLAGVSQSTSDTRTGWSKPLRSTCTGSPNVNCFPATNSRTAFET